MPAKKNVILYGCCSDPYPDITFTLQLKRRASFYIFNLLLPCMMISFLAPLGFYLPAESGEKVSLGVTVLLALTVFQLLVAESMPPSESVPLIGKYYIATMTMVTASTALTIFIMNLHHCGPEARPVPDWVRVLVLKYLNRVCLVYELGETCTRETEESQAAKFAHSWEVNADDHSGFKCEELSVTIEKPENDKPICARRVQNLTQTRDAILRPPEIKNNTICSREGPQGQNGGPRKEHELQKTGFKDSSGINCPKTDSLKEGRREEGGTRNRGATKFQGEREDASRGEEQVKHEVTMEQDGEEVQDGGDVSETVKSGDEEEVVRARLGSKDVNGTLDVETEKDTSATRTKVFRKSSSESGAGVWDKNKDVSFADDSRDEMQTENLRKQLEFVEENDKFQEVAVRCVCCHCCCRHLGVGFHGDSCGCRLRGDAAWRRLRGDVTSIATSFQEQRDAQTLIGDWRKVAKVLDRALMWIFFIMVFVMSVLILGKSI